MTYASVGVDYTKLDWAKVLGQELGAKTITGPNRFGVKPLEEFRGESSYVLELPDGSHLAHVEEGLGTKVLMADFLYKKTGVFSGYHAVGQDTVAMIVNDMATLGIPPVSLQMHLAVGSDDWLKDNVRVQALYQGWLNGALEAGAAWTGGETPALKDIVDPNTAVIAGSAVGYLERPHLPIREKITAGDAIIMLASSGVHANGITLVRRIAEKQPDGGVELCKKALVPTRVYVKAMNALRDAGIIPHYVIHVTGHGWRKIMRARSPFSYVIESIPWPMHDIFAAIQGTGNIETKEMWGNYNMGAGWTLVVAQKDVDNTLSVCCQSGYHPYVVGHVENGPKQVIIKPVDITFDEESMKLR